MTTLIAERVSAVVPGRRLVYDVNLTVTPGRLLALVGPNGAGKTSLLRLLAGDLEASSGRVLIGESDVADLHPSELSRLRAYLQHAPAVDIPFSARRVVALGRHAYRHDPGNFRERDAQAVVTAMADTETSELADRSFRTLSGGEQMRVSIARVLAQDTPIVLLDEPTAALDVGHGERVLLRLRNLAQAGKTVVVVLHDLNAAATHSDEVAVMAEGRIVALGSPESAFSATLLSEVYRHPLRVSNHPFGPGIIVLPEKG